MSMLEGLELHEIETDEQYGTKVPTSADARTKAEAEGLTIVYAKADQLFIDVDSDEDYAVFTQNYRILQEHYGTAGYKETPSKSGLPRRHIVVELYRKITNTERILLQAVLGSDRKREFLSWLEELSGDATPVLFLEKPAQPLLGTTVATALLTEGVTQ